MITEPLSTTAEPVPVHNTWLQNIPAPSEDSTNTLTQDYDRSRFYCRGHYGVSRSDILRTHAIGSRLEEFERFYTVSHALTMLQAPYWWIEHEKTFESNSDRIVNALGNWMASPNVECHAALIHCQFHNTNVPVDLLYFSYRHGILRGLLTAIDLVEKSFSEIQGVTLQIEKDPEVDEEWVTIDVVIKGEVSEILEMYNKYIDRFVSSVPWPERSKIRLSY